MAKIPAFNKHNFRIKDLALNDIGCKVKGMFISPKETVATDDHSLIKVSSLKIEEKDTVKVGRKALSNFKPFIIDRNNAEKVLKIFPKKETISMPQLNYLHVYSSNGKTAELGTCDLESINSIEIRSLEGKYPHYQELENQKGHYLEIEVNAKYLKRVVDFYAEFLKNKPTGLKIRIPKDPAKAIIFKAENKGQKADGLLMTIEPEKK